ncbi:MAG: glycoside hydrolase family 3 protein [Anaeromicrobium sp.]|jgi:beta-N-acetylhexosaminidase|uniref:glycoside hydrolase family 3 N-terminal domain-containing protein n=1 Tax=Anaeromicrobium sp. TaxID=1929132 RepID=UPI0025EFFBF9|nr:glycoside hydrolase family 3 protein [Anaeromicrobium sp.]MCT4595489.1 glycoside hydrolase family 3 protein [Anaeromicrobium sp.]
MRKIIFLLVVSMALISCTFKSEDKIIIDNKREKQEHVKTDPNLEILNKMTMDEKIGQLFIFGYDGLSPSEEILSFVEKDNIGGIIFFQRNVDTATQLKNSVNILKEANTNTLPLFFSIDEEGGTVSRIPNVKFKSHRQLGILDNTDETYKTGSKIGFALKEVGINMDFAPVLDMVSNTKNTLLYNRTFGGSSSIVSRHGEAFYRGLIDEGIIPVGKHFPGHGNTLVDSHKNLPYVYYDEKELFKKDILPFKNLIDKGLNVIMVGHISLPNIDSSNLPASQSSIIVNNILRDKLNFSGIAITDDTEMIGYASNDDEYKRAIVRSFNSGIDMFLVCHTINKKNLALNAIKEGLEKGIISEERLNESLYRIIKEKSKL